jgi:predicted metal-dependent hydrolase
MSPRKTHRHTLQLEEALLPLTVRKRRGTRRMVLRYQPLTREVTLTLPPYVSLREALAFAHSRRAWLSRQMAQYGAPIVFTDGAEIPVLGRSYRIRHMAQGRGVVSAADEELQVFGAPEFLARRVRDWVRAQLKDEIARRADAYGALLGVQARRITLRDTHSRWGSCSADGQLSFSWRLAFAPYAVMDYVVAHEVVHLREMNHGARFWKLVAEVCPEQQRARRWLAKHGHTLYRYGA